MDLIANMLYNEMLGSLPNFHTGSAVAVMMLLPSIISILLLTCLERYNIRYSKISTIEIPKNRARDSVCLLYTSAYSFYGMPKKPHRWQKNQYADARIYDIL